MNEQQPPRPLVNKAQVAARQIETAIDLIFDQRDPVSIRTLLFAANGVLRNLCQRKKVQSAFDKSLDEHVSPEMKATFIEYVTRHATFFKHASRDPDAAIELPADALNHGDTFVAILRYQTLGYAPTPGMLAFFNWMVLRNPQFLDPTSSQEGRAEKYRQLGALAQRLTPTGALALGWFLAQMARGVDHALALSELQHRRPSEAREIEAFLDAYTA